MERRDFMKVLAGGGALIATSKLPLLAEDKPEVFPERGGYERLALCYSTVEIGLEKPFSVLHISDTHLTAAYPGENEKKQTLNQRRTQTFGGRQEEALRDSLAWAKQHVDYVLHTGDLIDWQSEANFDLVRKYFGEGMTGSLGNHEFTSDMWLSEPKEEQTEKYKDYSREKLQSVYPFDISLNSQVVNGVNFVTLDDVYGYVTKQQVKRFHDEVKKGMPIVLCMHVPFYTDNIWRAAHRFWNEKGPLSSGVLPKVTGDFKRQLEDPVTSEFMEYLKKEPLLKCILAGHEHISVEDRFSPTCREYVTGSNFLFHGREVIFI
ncbi:MAG: metallophosphoesterase [Bacteroidales bacterium]|nr:metallophosphoesterase [Bacteroidales bacterium]